MAFLKVAVVAALATTARGIKLDASEDKSRPVTKVVKLLKGMQVSMEREAEEDEETYEKMTCWCKTNKEEKTKSIDEAEQNIKSLTARAAELNATAFRLGIQIGNLKDEVVENEHGLDTADTLREQQSSTFRTDEGQLVNSSDSVGDAIDTLSTNSSALLQMPKGQILGQLKTVVLQHKDLLTRVQLERLEEFIENPSKFKSDFLQRSAPTDTVGGVAGVLQGLRDDFGERLTTLRDQEQRDNVSYDALRTAKRNEIAAGRKQIETKTQQKASAILEMAEDKHSIKDTKASLAADTELMTQVKDRCGSMDTEFEKRRKMRSEELEAVAKALQILESDEARDSFGKTFSTSFLQLSSVGGPRNRAAALLAKAGEKDARLATLSLMMKLDTFEKVKEAIDGMVVDMKKQQVDEVGRKDWCIDELHKNQLQTETKNRDKDSLAAKLETLKSSEAQLVDEVKVLKGEVTEMEKQTALAGQNREKENKEFQTTITDQRKAQKQLKQALLVLKDYYSNPTGSLMQVSNSTDQASPEFKDYKQSSGNVGVMSMLQQLVSDAKAMEATATHDEQSAQEDYEAFANSTKAAIEAKNSAFLDKSEKKAQLELAVVQATQSKEGALNELKDLSEKEAEVHGSCDYLLTSFDARQSSREDEIEALHEAKAILSGAKE